MRLILTGTLMGHKWVAILWLQLTATSRTQAALQTIVSGVSSAWGANFITGFPNTYSLTSVEGIWITPGAGEIIATDNTVRTGTSTTAAVMDASATYVVSWRLNAYYRGGHPRTYLPGVRLDFVTNGSDITAGQLSTLQTSALAFLNAVNALTATGITATLLGTVSFQSGNAWRTPPIFRPYTGVGISSKLGTQRRRIHS